MKCILSLSFLCLLNLVSAQKLTPELLWKIGRVTDPQISPDGKKVLYNIRRFDLNSNKGNSDIWQYDFETKTSKPVASDSSNETSARWSNDGKKIYFLNDKSGNQLWSMNADGGGKVQVSKLTNDINEFGISGNGKMIWFTQNVKLDKFIGKEIYPDLPKVTAHVYDDLMMRHWDQWADGTYSHIFVSSLENDMISSPVDIMKDEHFESPLKPRGGAEEICISNDGKKIAYTCKKLSGKDYTLSTNSDIYLYDVDSKATTNITEDVEGYDKAPSISPDGKNIAWISWEEAGNEASLQRLVVADMSSFIKINYTDGFEYNVRSIQWLGENRIYFIADINATDQIFYLDPFGNDQAIKQLTSDVANFSEYSFTVLPSKEVKIVANRTSISEPNEIFSINAKTGNSEQLTFSNKDVLSGIKMGDVKKFIIKTTDNKEMLTWVTYPPDFDPAKKYPTLLYCQGGPQSTVSQNFSYRWNFQLMAANGYIVVSPNRRGLPGFGKAWNDQISNDWGGQAMKDLLSAIDSVSKLPYVNKDKLGAVGPSFGGFSVFWLMGHHQKRFKVFISHSGVFNFESMLATEEIFFHHHEYKGEYWDSPEPISYDKFSPHKFVENWDTPILIISNEKDYRVPYTQGLEAYTAARLKNIPARFISFPDEGHWVLKPQNSVMWNREFFGWLDKYLK